ncbi:MAG: ATP synthase F1 subunit epsilon [Candidatus Moranbacteria bacterium]|nr:ATP synthase F1 subunit epsilon [Candidatus Moranbacteria bacterium]
MSSIALKIMTPERLLLESEVVSVTLPVLEGEITVLPEHIPYIGALEAGEVRIVEASGKETSLVLSSGFVELHDNKLMILADTAELALEIDIERAEEARKRALELHKEEHLMGAEEYARTAAMLEKELARIKVGRKHRSRMKHMPGSME